MDRPGRTIGRGWMAAAILVGVVVSGLAPAQSWAKSAKLDRETVEAAEALCKDREAAFAEDPSMSTEDFQKAWGAFASELDSKYAGKDVLIGKFGSHIRVRQQFTLLIYVALRSQTKGVVLEPPVQDLIARHPFLQMLVTEGSCYIRNDRYPKKMSDFFGAYPQMALMVREQIETWASDHRKAFEEAFPLEAANALK